jgi:hypothetical protein
MTQRLLYYDGKRPQAHIANLVANVQTGYVGIGTNNPTNTLSIEKSNNSGSGADYPRIKVMNTLATQGDGSSTFNFADINISSGNEAVNMFLSTTYAAGLWAPSGILNVATNHDFQIRTAATERMRIKNDGNVGIGTSTPSSKLTVLKTITSNPGSTGNAAVSLGTAGSAGEYNLINFGYDSGNWQPAYLGYLCTSGSGSSNGALVFATRASTSDVQPTEKMRIVSNGNVGIGTVDPESSRLLVRSSTTDAATNIIQASNSSGATRFIVRSDGLTSFYGTDNAEKVRITENGNVGIGTDGPLDLLQLRSTSATAYDATVDDGQYGNGAGITITNMDQTNESFAQVNMQVSGAAGRALGRIVTIRKGFATSDMAFITENGGIISEKMRITSDGNVGIGIVPAAGVKFQVSGGVIRSLDTFTNTTTTAANMVVSAGGTFERQTPSSQRYKENIVDWSGGLDVILSLKPRTFKYKKDYYDKADVDFLGLIAEEVSKVCPYLVDYENEDRTGQEENVRYANIVVPLIKAIQELKAEIDSLKNISS